VLPPAVLGEEVRRVDEVAAEGFPEGFGGASGEEGVGCDTGREVEGAGEMAWVADAGEEGEAEPASGRGERVVVRMGRFGEHDGRFQLVLFALRVLRDTLCSRETQRTVPSVVNTDPLPALKSGESGEALWDWIGLQRVHGPTFHDGDGLYGSVHGLTACLEDVVPGEERITQSSVIDRLLFWC